MTFFEKELRHIFETDLSDATYADNCCLVKLSPRTRAQLCFDTNGIPDHYGSLRIRIIDCANGATIDSTNIVFLDIFGLLKTDNPCFPDGWWPHVWTGGGHEGWYEAIPGEKEYDKLRKIVFDYINRFR